VRVEDWRCRNFPEGRSPIDIQDHPGKKRRKVQRPTGVEFPCWNPEKKGDGTPGEKKFKKRFLAGKKREAWNDSDMGKTPPPPPPGGERAEGGGGSKPLAKWRCWGNRIIFGSGGRGKPLRPTLRGGKKKKGKKKRRKAFLHLVMKGDTDRSRFTCCEVERGKTVPLAVRKGGGGGGGNRINVQPDLG